MKTNKSCRPKMKSCSFLRRRVSFQAINLADFLLIPVRKRQ